MPAETMFPLSAAAREFEGVMQGGPIRNRARHLLGENLLAPCFG
jgi:hypothetical protein